MGTRMKSGVPKVLHKAAGRSLLGHVLTGTAALAARQTVIVVGPDMEAVGQEAQRYIPGSAIAIQTKRLGTGHAVLAARESLAGFSGIVIVVYADAPLISAASIARRSP